MAEKPKIFGTLITEVIRPGYCTFCGACVASCPVDAIGVKGEEPVTAGRCVLCQVCYYQCPMTSFDEATIRDVLFGQAETHDEDIGYYRSIYEARSTKKDVLKRSQDGGAVTSILASALESGQADAAVVAGLSSEDPWRPEPRVATTYEELLECAGTKYTPSGIIRGVGSAVIEYGKKSVAVVGTPDQVQAVRIMQHTKMGDLNLGNAVALTIGLFCMESYSYDKLLSGYLREKSIDLHEISRMEISSGRFKVHAGRKTMLETGVEEIRPYTKNTCKYCNDFAASYADLSAGNIGSPEGWTTIIVRTERGEQAYNKAVETGFLKSRPVKHTKTGLDFIRRLAKIKKRRCLSRKPP